MTIKKEYPELEDLMFRNKEAIKRHKKKEGFKKKRKRSKSSFKKRSKT